MSAAYLDEWLDEYNDYMRLFEIFGDEEYRQEANEIIESLKVMLSRREYNKVILYKLESDTMHKL
ncbi:hypothetical protein [Paenibacillus aestuarii]|uniref:Uncharacterized protein n=1 Tax=Paenibacillus aestuarii TaxID=516965 RepID=A0ABW0K8R1_9BACL|nr:hypothetical protein [Paenibacillus aestuarii]